MDVKELSIRYSDLIKNTTNSNTEIIFKNDEINRTNGDHYGLGGHISISFSLGILSFKIVNLPFFCGSCVVGNVYFSSDNKPYSYDSIKCKYDMYYDILWGYIMDLAYIDNYSSIIITDNIMSIQANKYKYKLLLRKPYVNKFHQFINRRSRNEVKMFSIDLLKKETLSISELEEKYKKEPKQKEECKTKELE